MSWYAVRCIFQQFTPDRADELAVHQYEERITIWTASTSDEAIEYAEAEARSYAESVADEPDVYLGLAQSYELYDDPAKAGSEVFSLIRSSGLGPSDYLDHFYHTGTERAQSL